MWKENYEVPPSSAIRHLTLENLNFVLNLRKEKDDINKPPIKTRKPPLPSARRHSVVHNTAILKDTGCKNRSCLQANNDLLTEIDEVKSYNIFHILYLYIPIFFLSATYSYG